MMRKEFDSTKQFLVLFLLIAYAAIFLFKSSVGQWLLIGAIILNISRVIVRIETILFLLLIVAFEVYHNLYFDNYEVKASLLVLFYFGVSILVVYILRINFVDFFIKIIYFFTIISLPVFLLIRIAPALAVGVFNVVPSFLQVSTTTYEQVHVHINPIFYNYDYNSEAGRNNGPFWEPTVFATMITIAQIFNFLSTKKIFNIKGIFFSLGVLSTLSTTGALVYFLLVLIYFTYINRNRVILSVIVNAFILVSGLSAYFFVPYLHDKIVNEFGNVDKDIQKRGGDSRTASAVLDIREVKQEDIYLILGKGSSKNTRIGSGNKDVLRNCGLTSLLVEYGVPFFLLYFLMVYYSFYQMCEYYRLPALMAIGFTLLFMLSGYSEVFFDLPFFHCFLFLGFIFRAQNKDVKTVRLVIVDA